ncbi:MAG: type II secretion system F family protein [Candidatus Colwellbacteria bacterium]|nr:type II secretion system F family protein [Candidatus Colwellbacteria bacterium]
MRFYYIASHPNGQVVEGNIEAQNPSAVLDWMLSQGLRPVSIKAIGGVETKKKRFALFGERIAVEDKVFLTKYLALMLRVGTDLFRAIDILIADFDKPVMRSLLVEVRDTLAKGQPFYTTFAKYPKYFPSVYVNLIKAGETSGNLDGVLDRLSKDLEKEWALRNRIKSTLIYPIILVGLSLLVLFLMVSFALPKIAETFMGGALEPPLFSRVVFTIGLFLKDFTWLIMPLLIISAFGLWFFFKRTLVGRRLMERLAYRLPVIREVMKKISLERFASVFSSLIRSGTPILEAIEITADAVGSVELKQSLIRISREGIAKGLTVGEAFRREVYFPRVVVNLIAVSERGGHLEEVLETLADFYESEIDSSIKILVSFLEPILLLFIGLVVGGIALAVIIPVYQLVSSI